MCQCTALFIVKEEISGGFQFLDLVGRAFFPDGIGKLLNVGHSQKLYRGVPPISV